MIYLDYSATTPVLSEVLDSYVRVTNEFIGNANSIHNLGVKSKELLMKATNQISDILGVKHNEIIYTSGASESNSTALKGVAFKYKNRGKHIISSYLEHKSVLETLDFLSECGFEISYVKINELGQIDLNDLERLVRKDTILVSICSVNSEVGCKASLKTIRQVIKKKNPSVIFHSDMTQALGKTKVNLSDVDLASFSGHKIYAPKGIGLLYKREGLEIEPLIFGLTENAKFRGGTPALPLIVSFSKALRIISEQEEQNIKNVVKMNEVLTKFFNDLGLVVNSNNLCVPHIINVSLLRIKPETFVRALEREDIYISTNSACSSLSESVVLKRMTDNKEINTTGIRISISYYTKMNEIKKFMESFEKTYKSLLFKE